MFSWNIMVNMPSNVSHPQNDSELAAPDHDAFHHYLPISDPIFHSGIYVTAAGRRTAHRGENYLQISHPPLYQFDWNEGRILPDFAFVLVNAGHGIFESRTMGQVAVAAGMGFLIFPGVWHRFAPCGRSVGRCRGWRLAAS